MELDGAVNKILKNSQLLFIQNQISHAVQSCFVEDDLDTNQNEFNMKPIKHERRHETRRATLVAGIYVTCLFHIGFKTDLHTNKTKQNPHCENF